MPGLVASPELIQETKAFLHAMLRLRYSSPLFRLPPAAILEQVRPLEATACARKRAGTARHKHSAILAGLTPAVSSCGLVCELHSVAKSRLPALAIHDTNILSLLGQEMRLPVELLLSPICNVRTPELATGH